MEIISETMDIDSTNILVNHKIEFAPPEGFTIEALKSYTEAINNFASKSEEEKLVLFSNIYSLLKNLHSASYLSEEMPHWQANTLEERESYYIKVFSTRLLKEIANTPNDLINIQLREKIEEVVHLYINEFILHLQNIRLLPLWESIVALFSDSKLLHKSRGKEFHNADRFLELNYDIFNPSEDWSKNLKKGDQVDFLSMEREFFGQANERRTFGLWTQAEIIDIIDDGRLRLRLNGKGDLVNNVAINSPYMLPLGTLSSDYEWRESLKYGHKVDILDSKSWHLGTVMEVLNKPRGGKNYNWIKYGIRVYKKDGKSEDSRKRFFFGWGESFDREVPVHDARIRQPNSFSKEIQFYEALVKYPSDSHHFNEVETYIPFQFKNKKFFSVGRRTDKDVDIAYVNLINFFGDQNGFDKILQLFSNSQTNNLSFEQMSLILTIVTELIDYIHSYLHITFAKTFLKSFIENSFNFLKDFANIPENRNLKKEKFELFLKRLKEIMGRIYIETDVNFKFENFSLDFSIACLNSNQLEKKLIGLKMLTDVLTEINRSSPLALSSQYLQHLPVSRISDILIRENIFNILFGPNTHLQLVQKSSELIKAMINAKMFREEELNGLYLIYKENSDVNVKMAVYKMMKDNTLLMGNNLQKFLLRIMLDKNLESNFQNETNSQFFKEELELMLQLHQKLPIHESEKFNKELGSYFYNLIFNVDISDADKEFFETVLSETVNLFRSWDFKHERINFIESILTRVREQKDVIKSLKVIRRIISSTSAALEEYMKNKIFYLMLDDYDIVNVIINFLQDYHLNKNEANIKDNSNIHNTEIVAEFFSFLNFLINNSSKKLFFSLKQIESLYFIIVENQKQNDQNSSQSESNQFFKFLREADEKKLIPPGTFAFIFSKMVENKNLEFNNLSLEMMKVLWSIFLSVNRDNKKLEIRENQAAKTSNQIISSWNNNNNNNNKPSQIFSFNPEDILSINCSLTPFDLDGFELIYKVVVSSQYGDMSKICISNFIQLFKCGNKNEQDRGVIWNELIRRAIGDIKEILNRDDSEIHPEKMSRIESESYNKILNLLLILKSLIEESEKKGTAGVISHSSINKSAVITLRFNTTNMKNIELEMKQFSLKVFSNSTIWDLKNLIAKKLKMIPEMIRLEKEKKEISDNDHGKTVADIQLKDEDLLHVFKNTVLENIPRVSLVDDFGNLNERVEALLREIFYKYASHKKSVGMEAVTNINSSVNVEGEGEMEVVTNINSDANAEGEGEICMNKTDCAEYTKVATGTDSDKKISEEDPRVISFFENYDDDKDGLLTFDNFVQFYQNKYDSTKFVAIWENLSNFGIRYDLKKLNEPLDEYNSKREFMPRWIIAKDPEYFILIFSLQEKIKTKGSNNSEILHKEACKFLNLICTNPVIYRNILLLDKDDWSSYIEEENYYKQLYSLQIIESFFEEFEMGSVDVDSEPIEMSNLEHDMNLLQANHKVFWLETFLVKGGLQHILKIFMKSCITGNGEQPDYLSKKTLNMLIKIIRSSFLIIQKVMKYSNEYTQDDKEEILRLIRKDSISPENALNEEKEADYNINNYNETNLSNALMTRPRLQSVEIYEELMIKHLYENNREILSQIFSQGEYNYTCITKKLLTILYQIVNKNEPDSEERLLVATVNNLFCLIYISQADLTEFTHFLFNIAEDNDMSFEKLILQGLYNNNNLLIRANMYKTLKNLSKNLYELKEFDFLVMLINLIQRAIFSLQEYNNNSNNNNSSSSKNCKYLFLLEERLISYSVNNSYIQEKIHIKLDDKAFKIYDILNCSSDSIEDEMLIGYLKTLAVLVKYRPSLKSLLGKEQNLIKLLINKYTLKESKYTENNRQLNINLNEYLEIENLRKDSDFSHQSEEIRNSIFNLIINLCEDNADNLLLLFQTKITDIPWQISKEFKDKKRSNYYNPDSEQKSSSGFVGIKNLGAICYMNSMLQQFFNIPTLRYSLLQINDGKSFTQSEDTKEPIDDNLLHQIQKMFTFLQFSNRISYNPKDFCFAYKDFMGARTNLTQQQDAQEFLGRLFDLLESSISKTPYKYLLQSVFGGKTCSQLVCKECGNTKNNFEDFFNLSLEVRNLKTLKDSLDKFTSEEKIEGVNCDTCMKKTSCSKKNSLAELPNVLIIHLQRIGFNYDTGMNEKVNSKLEFPKHLNLKSYCTEEIEKKKAHSNIEGMMDNVDIASNCNFANEFTERVYDRENDYYEYVLVGVVVHIGHADAGHYVSYINTLREGIRGKWVCDSNSDSTWLNFNDAYVTSFDIKTLEANCFGGLDSEIRPVPAPPGINITNDYLTSPPAGIYPQNINAVSNGYNEPYQNIETGQSAYMLIYERVKKSPIKIVVPNQEVSINNNNCITVNKENMYALLKSLDVFNPNPNNTINTGDLISSALDEFNSYSSFLIFDEEKQEYIQYAPFYQIPKRIPFNYYKEVSNDNLYFYNDQKIFNKNFNEFIEKILSITENILNKSQISKNNIKDVEDIEEIEEKKIVYIFEVILSFVIEVISKSYHKQNLKGIIDRVNNLMTHFPVISNSIITYLNNKKELLIDLLFSSEESSNSGYKSLLLTAINNTLPKSEDEMMVDTSNITLPPSLILLSNLIDLLPVEASKNWSKMLSYLELLEELVKVGNEVVIDFLLKKNIVSRLIDFFLGRESPAYLENENRDRIEMGKSGVNAKFAPLIATIAQLISKWKKEAFTEKDLIFLNEKKFYLNSIKENYNNTEMSRIMAGMMYNNYDFTKFGVFLILDLFNRNNTLQEAKNGMDLLTEIIKIEDELTQTRIEWIFGIPQVEIKLSQTVPALPFNICKNGDKLYIFVSPILQYCSKTHDSLTDRIFYKYWTSVDFLLIVNMFINSVLFVSKSAFRYFDSLPHPKPSANIHTASAKAKDFLFELANEEINRFNTYSSVKTNEKAIQLFHQTFSKYDEYYNIYVRSNSEIEKNLQLMSNHNYKKGPIHSDLIQLCPQQGELTANNIFLISIDISSEVKPDVIKEATNIFSSKPMNTYYNPPEEEGVEILPAQVYNHRSEDEFYKSLCKSEKFLQGLKYRRVLQSFMPEGAVIMPTFRRYIVLNLSEVDYKLKFRFTHNNALPEDVDGMNLFLPTSEIVIINKKMMGQNIFTFTKADVNRDFGDYSVEVEVIPLARDSQMLNAGNQGAVVNVFLDEEKKIEERKEKDVVIPHDDVVMGGADYVEIECPFCHRQNFINDNEFRCLYCRKELFN